MAYPDFWKTMKIQELPGHDDVTTTEIYLHVSMGAHGMGVTSPLDWQEIAGAA